MALSDTLLAQLNERVSLLQSRQIELQRKRDGELLRIQRQIDACQTLIAGWNSTTISVGLDLFPQTGISFTL